MTLNETSISGLYIIEPRVFEDPRGYFFESYSEKILQKNGINFRFVQDNQSRSEYGVIRGLHFQRTPHAQAKLVRVLEGEIYDVAVDLRSGSPTFGQWYGLRLSSENKKQMLIPKGFAHGFSVLSTVAIVLYKCDDFYFPETEGGISYCDPELNIDWKIEPGNELVSEKDKNLPHFNRKVSYF
ncbi:MAG: dTDP-4-dehydrorhamnose 3,5-epimerase [Bacteroidales bacterium]|nr:dTDP-4-dehydrorhamnose 3,5-epimerase [Bacteroidales bacterium]